MPSRRGGFIAGLIFSLAVVWPIPHTIALRNFLMGGLLITLWGGTNWEAAGQFARGAARASLFWFLLFTAWILVVAFFVSPFPKWSLSEIEGQWFMGAGALLIGALVALQKDSTISSLAIKGALAALVIQAMAVDAQGLWVVGSSDSWLHMARLGGVTAGPGKMSYLTNFLLSALVAEWSLVRETPDEGGARLWWVRVGLILCGLSIYFEAMRNEIFDISVFVLFVGVVLYRAQAVRAPRRAALAVAGMGFIFAAVASTDIILDPRWRSLWATIPIALDTSHHLAWLNAQRFPLPHLPDGQVVSASNYLRIAWIKEGIKEVFAHPLGVGYGRAAFEHALRLKFGSLSTDIGLNNSLLTIAIGTGVPGAAIWLCWLGSVVRFSAARLSGSGAFAARFLFLIVMAFAVRMAVDNDMQNYTLEQVLFFIGLLMPLAASGENGYAAQYGFARSMGPEIGQARRE